MRLAHTKDGYRILDCYHGNGVIWDRIKKVRDITVTGIEKEKGKGSIALYGACEKVIPRLDLSAYHIIDLDAWGIPYLSLQAVFRNKTLKPGTVILYTFIQAVLGRAPNGLFEAIGISKPMIKKCPTLFTGLAFDGFKEYLRKNGVKSIHDLFCHDGTSRKHYGWFTVDGGGEVDDDNGYE